MKTNSASMKTTIYTDMIRLFFILSIITFGLIGCGGQGPGASISASPGTILLGQSAVLTWSTQGADSVSINNGIGTVEPRGTIVVIPFRTTTYTLSAVSADGKTEKSVTITVVHSEGAPTVSITATPMTIQPGGESLLSWSSSNAYSAIIDNGIGNVPVNYSITVQPAATTVYTIHAIGPGGTSTASVTINVMSAAPSTNITANPTSIKPGETSLLEWSYANADTVTIEPGIGDGTQLKSTEISPDITTTYVITAIGPGGTATARVTVIVSDEYNPLQAHIEAVPTQINTGETSLLTWKTNNAARAWIEPDIGDVQLNGSMTVSPLETTTYILHATQNGDTSMDSVTVNVISYLPEVSIVAEKETIKPYETTVLTWKTQNADSVEIDQGIGSVSTNGSIEISPVVTTTYTIKATGLGGVATASVTINVMTSDIPLGNQQFAPDSLKNIDILNNYRLTTQFSQTKNLLLPDKIDWSNKIPIVKSQGKTGSGNAWAMAYYLKSFQESILQQQLVEQVMFSPMLTYVFQCKIFSTPWDIVNTWHVMHQYGTALWDKIPFEDLTGFMDNSEIEAYSNYSLNQDIIDHAFRNRSGTPIVLNTLDQIQMILTQAPVVLAINRFDPDKPEQGIASDQNFLVHDKNRSDLGHAVLCIGYDNDKFGVGALKLVNSWGKDWGQEGISWIKYPDMQNIIVAALMINDIPKQLVSATYHKRPDEPENVFASDNVGPFVDISWTHVSSARYYKIFRAPASSLSSTHEIYDYEWIGISDHSPFRDYAYPGEANLYAVVAVNEFGESEMFDNQNATVSYIDQGIANGKIIETPVLSIAQQSSGTSEYDVQSIPTEATGLQVFASQHELGPWQSLGWIKPVNQFMINWQKDGTWTGYQPYVRVIAENTSGEFSRPSQAVMVSSAISPNTPVATIDKLDAYESDMDAVKLSWSLAGGQADYIDIWRKHDKTAIWIKLDTISATLDSYFDTKAIKGISYYYAVYGVYQGISGLGKETTQAAQLSLNQPNIKISHVEYDSGALMEPLEMELTIENNGNTAIDTYKFKIMIYNWENHQVDLCLEDSIENYPDLKRPLLPGNQHVFTATFDLPAYINKDVLFSWYILIDSDAEITEAYEEDNIFWAQKMCWMNMDKQ